MEVKNISIGEVYPSPMNPRKTFDEDALQELTDNIRQQGLIQPITVRPRAVQAALDVVVNGYEIVCGERRYRAMCNLNAESPEQWPTISAIVREMTDDEAFDAMITKIFNAKMLTPSKKPMPSANSLRKAAPLKK